MLLKCCAFTKDKKLDLLAVLKDLCIDFYKLKSSSKGKKHNIQIQKNISSSL